MQVIRNHLFVAGNLILRGVLNAEREIALKGSLSVPVTVITIPTYVIGENDFMIFADCGVDNINITIQLPPASQKLGRVLFFKKLDNTTFTATINASAGEYIDGISGYILSAQYQFLGIISIGSNWYIISQ